MLSKVKLNSGRLVSANIWTQMHTDVQQLFIQQQCYWPMTPLKWVQQHYWNESNNITEMSLTTSLKWSQLFMGDLHCSSFTGSDHIILPCTQICHIAVHSSCHKVGGCTSNASFSPPLIWWNEPCYLFPLRSLTKQRSPECIKVIESDQSIKFCRDSADADGTWTYSLYVIM